MDNRGGKFAIGLKPLLLLAVFFIALFANTDSAQARTNIYAPGVDINTPTTWTATGSPYVISGYAWLDVTSTLTIDAGVVVKFIPDNWNHRYNGLNVSGGGKIIANGTGDTPVIFTSYYDDTASGDTNGDGATASPVAGDWRGIILDADASELSHVEVRYSANIYQSYGGIEIKNNSTASLSDVSIKYSAGSALRLNQPASPTIANITIDTSNDYGLYSTIAGSSINVINANITNCTDGVAVLSVANTLAFTNAMVANTKPVINLTGATVSVNATWPKIGSAAYVLDNDISVPGVTLTIAPGVVVKGEYGLYPDSRLEISGRLLAQGTADQPIVFTSLRDDTAGGDSNNDGTASAPAAGDWGGLYFENSANSVLEYATVRYGGNYSDDFNGVFYATTDNVMLHLKNSSLAIATSTIGLANTAIYLESASGLTLSGSTVATTTTAILSSSSLGSTISNTSFINNTHFAISNFGSGQIDGRHNWWADDSGPTVASNPGGVGNAISSNVLYDPWIVQIPPNQAPTLSYVATSGYTADGVEPNVSFKNSTLPVFKVLYSDAENTVSYVRLVTASSTVAMATSTGGVYEYTPASGTFGKASYTYHFEASDGVANVRLPATGELSFEVKNIPVILVPGVMGTELKQDIGQISFTFWPNIQQMIFWFLDDFMDPLAMNTDGSPSDSSVIIGDMIRSLSGGLYNIFAGLENSLVSIGYEEDNDLFVFPYDWRLDIRNSSQKLKDKIDAVLTQTGSQKIDVVAHSMGGLVTKQYTLDNTAAKIDKLIFVGTPHLGSPKSAKMLLFGDHLVKIFVPLLNPGEMKYLAQNMLSVYQLLPSSSYFTQIGRYIYDLTNSQSFDYQGTKQYLTDTGRNATLLQNAYDFHTSALDDFAVGNLDAYNIVGCDSATLGKILIRNGVFTGTEYGLELVPGDGTVPLESADAVTLPSNKVFYAKGVEHATMPSQASIRQLITQIITGNADISSLPDITQNINQCVFNGQIVSVYSPVDLHVYDSNGNHVGPDSNGDIELNIPGATYEQIGSDKFVFLPNASGVSYNVQLDGTGNGTFSLRVEKVENNQVTETAYYNDVPVTESGAAQVTLASNVSGTVLQVDQSGTGSFTTAPVSAVLDSAQAADVTQPISTIAVSGGQTSATVSLSATDDNAGVLKIEYSLNNGTTWNTYGNSFIITTLGSNTLQYRAIDRAGNREDVKSQTITVVSAPAAVIPLATGGSTANSEPTATPSAKAQVLGAEQERPQRDQYSKDDILQALNNADGKVLLDYLGRERDVSLENSVKRKYSKDLTFNAALTNFIAYGTKSTLALGEGERASVLRSYQETFKGLPKTMADWEDLINIATGELPSRRNKIKEQRVNADFKKINNREANLSKDQDVQSIMTMAYGLRPKIRDLDKERASLKVFVRIYRRLPRDIADWDIIRAISYY